MDVNKNNLKNYGFVYLFLQTNSLTFLLVYYIMKATNNKKYSDLGFRLFTRASKKQNKISKKKNPKIFD